MIEKYIIRQEIWQGTELAIDQELDEIALTKEQRKKLNSLINELRTVFIEANNLTKKL